jgi:hypothetical protein
MREERRNKEKTGRQLTCLLTVTEERKADFLRRQPNGETDKKNGS